MALSGITLADVRHLPVGHHRRPCPACDRGPKDDALNLSVRHDGTAVFYCHRCGHSGLVGAEVTHRPALRPAPVKVTANAALSTWGRDLWASCQPIGGDAFAYLTERGCVIPPADGDLRWHPHLRHPTGYEGPAIVGLITDALSGEPLSLHRTWILPNGTKADVRPPRLLLKDHRKAGGVIRLWPHESVTTGLAVSEGIESALAAATVSAPVWATIDAGNLATLPVLPGVEALTIFADHDQAGISAAEACAQRWYAAGREVRILTPTAKGCDFADLARAVA